MFKEVEPREFVEFEEYEEKIVDCHFDEGTYNFGLISFDGIYRIFLRAEVLDKDVLIPGHFEDKDHATLALIEIVNHFRESSPNPTIH